MKNAVGKHNTILNTQVTGKHPWFVDYRNSSIVLDNPNNEKQGGKITCAINRDWRTDWSDFNLEGGMKLKTKFGYRVYATIDS